MKINIYNQKAEIVGEKELSAKVFGVKPKEALIHQAAEVQMANERQVLAHTLGRSDVRGGGRKPWKQKGTGRARAGTRRSPLWKGGGIIFGPTSDRNFSKDINKKMRQKALCMVLSDRVESGAMALIDKFELGEYKTKSFDAILAKIEEKALPKAAVKAPDAKADDKTKKKKTSKAEQYRSILVINDDKDPKTMNSARNLKGVTIINLENINIIDLLKNKNLVITQGAVETLEKRYGKA